MLEYIVFLVILPLLGILIGILTGQADSNKEEW